MIIFKNKAFKSYLVLTSFLLLIEVVFSILNHTNVLNFYLSFVKIFLLINIFSSVVGYISSLFKENVTKIINFTVVLAFSIYAYLQLGFYNYLGVYISLNTSSQFGAVKDYVKDFLAAIKLEYYMIFIPVILLLIIYIVINKIKKADAIKPFRKIAYQKSISFVLCAIIASVSSLVFYHLLDDRYLSAKHTTFNSKELFTNASNPSLFVKEYGLLSFAFVDMKNVGNYAEKSLLYDNIVHNKPIDETENARYIDDSLWRDLIDSEQNISYNSLNYVFINRNVPSKNEYTGLFEGKNLIVIMMESVNDVIDNEEYFPNFYKLAHEGWYFKNNYSPRNSCATGNNEFSAMTGLYSIYDTCTTEGFVYNTYPTAIFNLFNNKNYITNSFHDFTQAYYSREVYHPNMGSQRYYGAQALGIDYNPVYGEWASDEDFMEAYLKVIDEKDDENPFMSFLITVSSHQPFTTDNTYGNLYLDLTENTDLPMVLRRYYSKLKVVDNALGILVDGLEERGLLDDTVIVLFGDHYPYGIPLETLNIVLDRSLEDYENEKVPFVIYNPSLEPTVYDKYTSYLNITPTMANLFNLDYDPRLYAGEDIFSSDYSNTVVFPDLSWKNDKAYYNSNSDEITYFTDEVYTDEEIKNIDLNNRNLMAASENAIIVNYMEYLDNQIHIDENIKNSCLIEDTESEE